MMSGISRREFAKGVLATAAIASVPRMLWGASLISTVGGVKVGIQTTSMNPLADVPGRDHTDTVIAACLQVGLANIEYYAGFGPPVPNAGIGAQVPAKLTPEYEQAREELRKWEQVQFARRYEALAEDIASADARLEAARVRHTAAAAHVAFRNSRRERCVFMVALVCASLRDEW